MFKNRSEDEILKHYKRDEDGNYIIELIVSDIDEIFSQYDPSPMHQKDIEPAVINTILSQIVVFPEKSRVELHIHLPKKLQKKKYEAKLEQAIKHHLEYEVLDHDLHMQRRVRKGLRTFMYAVMVFIILFSLSYILSHSSSEFVILHLLAEGLAIGSWVSLWHPIEMLLYDWLPLYEEKKRFKKLLELNLKFKYV